jgi:hypothetical protein
MSISSNLVQIKINPGGVAAFGQSLPILHPELSPCAARYNFDQYGREAPAESIDTETCPGLYSAESRIEVENSLRPFLSPKYFGLPLGISGGADTLFGNAGSAGRTIDYVRDIDLSLGGMGTKNIQTSPGVAADTAVRQSAMQNLGQVAFVPNVGNDMKYQPVQRIYAYK